MLGVRDPGWNAGGLTGRYYVQRWVARSGGARLLDRNEKGSEAGQIEAMGLRDAITAIAGYNPVHCPVMVAILLL